MLKQIFEIVGYISTCLVIIWTLIQIYKSIFKQKEKLGYTYKKINILNYENEPIKKKYHEHVDSILPILAYKYKDGTSKDVVVDLKANIIAHQYIFRNIGNIKIEGKQFYRTEKLGLKSSDIILATVNKETPKYVNPQITIDNEKLEIDFEVLDPKDEISITVLTKNHLLDMKILGKTENIKIIKPIDYESLEEGNSYSYGLFYRELLICKFVFNAIKSSAMFWCFVSLLPCIIFIIYMILSGVFDLGELNG